MMHHLHLLILIIILLLHITSSAHQIDYNHPDNEYCYNESNNLGICLGKYKREHPGDAGGIDAQIIQCTECSGNFFGDETCDELKTLNDIAIRVDNDSSNSGTSSGSDSGSSVTNNPDSTTSTTINWNESFCETYNRCVQTNCPQKCWHEQEEWIQCLVIELDCDWRCMEGEEWLMMGNSVENRLTDGMKGMMLGSNSAGCFRRGSGGSSMLGIIMMVGLGGLLWIL